MGFLNTCCKISSNLPKNYVGMVVVIVEASAGEEFRVQGVGFSRLFWGSKV